MQIKTFQLGPLGTNCYVLWADGAGGSKEAAVIDPADFTQGLKAIFESEGLDLKYVILTHGHGDHVGGVNLILEAFPDAKLAAGRDEMPILGDAAINFSGDIYGKAETFAPDILLDDGDELKLGDISVRVITTPGHTSGGISLLACGSVFVGDTLFKASVGRTDLPTGNYETLEKSIREKLYVLPDETVVYPGHMEATEIGYEKRHNGFVRQ